MQTVDIPDSHRLVIDVPNEIPAGRAIITFTPVAIAGDGLDYESDCPICAANRDLITGNPRYNTVTLAAFEEAKAIMRGEIPAKRYRLSEMLEKVNDANIHPEVETTGPVGNEIW